MLPSLIIEPATVKFEIEVPNAKLVPKNEFMERSPSTLTSPPNDLIPPLMKDKLNDTSLFGKTNLFQRFFLH